MQDYFLESRGIAYRTNEFKPGQKTIIFVHGLSGSASAWKPFEKHFEGTYNVVTYDLRGHGLSKRYKTYENYKIDCFAEDLKALVDHLGIDRCVLVGHSFGAIVALAFAAQHCSLVEKIIFLSPSYRIGTYSTSRLSNPLLALATGLYALFPMFRIPGKRIDYTTMPRPSPDFSLRRIVPEIHAMSLRIYIYCLRQLYAYNQINLWRQIAAPTLVIHGEDDTFVPIRYGIAASGAVANAQLRVLPKANHMLVLNNASEIIDELAEFIA